MITTSDQPTATIKVLSTSSTSSRSLQASSLAALQELSASLVATSPLAPSESGASQYSRHSSCSTSSDSSFSNQKSQKSVSKMVFESVDSQQADAEEVVVVARQISASSHPASISSRQKSKSGDAGSRKASQQSNGSAHSFSDRAAVVEAFVDAVEAVDARRISARSDRSAEQFLSGTVLNATVLSGTVHAPVDRSSSAGSSVSWNSSTKPMPLAVDADVVEDIVEAIAEEVEDRRNSRQNSYTSSRSRSRSDGRRASDKSGGSSEQQSSNVIETTTTTVYPVVTKAGAAVVVVHNNERRDSQDDSASTSSSTSSEESSSTKDDLKSTVTTTLYSAAVTAAVAAVATPREEFPQTLTTSRGSTVLYRRILTREALPTYEADFTSIAHLESPTRVDMTFGQPSTTTVDMSYVHPTTTTVETKVVTVTRDVSDSKSRDVSEKTYTISAVQPAVLSMPPITTTEVTVVRAPEIETRNVLPYTTTTIVQPTDRMVSTMEQTTTEYRPPVTTAVQQNYALSAYSTPYSTYQTPLAWHVGSPAPQPMPQPVAVERDVSHVTSSHYNRSKRSKHSRRPTSISHLSAITSEGARHHRVEKKRAACCC